MVIFHVDLWYQQEGNGPIDLLGQMWTNFFHTNSYNDDLATSSQVKIDKRSMQQDEAEWNSLWGCAAVRAKVLSIQELCFWSPKV